MNWMTDVLMQAGETGATAASVSSANMHDVLMAVGFLAVAAILLLLEFLVVSYGLLAIAALGCAITGIVLGFGQSETVGWMLLAATPIIGTVVVAWGLRRLTRSDLVPKQAITENAGYRHATASLGIVEGTRGTLVTDAMPTGRARFPGGDIDVMVEGPAATKGTVVTVLRIEGASVFVAADSGSRP
jgi:membrane-bound ClpP family serine protease